MKKNKILYITGAITFTTIYIASTISQTTNHQTQIAWWIIWGIIAITNSKE